jgi:prophage DNA circulation protein
MATSPWKVQLRPASFRGAGFKVDAAARAGGRRQSLFEFPKRDEPYAEDMGRRARRFVVSGYLIGPGYLAARDLLVDALEREGPGLLVHYLFGEFMVSVDTYTVNERRERGGFCEVDIQFVEAGTAPAAGVADDTRGKVNSSADKAIGSAQSSAETKAKEAGSASNEPVWT